MSAPTLDQFIAAVRGAATAKPDFVYQRRPLAETGQACRYTPDAANPTGCVMGTAAAALGIGGGFCANEGLGVVTVLAHLVAPPLSFNSKEAGWLALAQSAQDRGESWSEAVRLADAEYPEVAHA